MTNRRTFPDRLTPDQHEWLYDAKLSRIFDAIAAVGGEARVVGGAVRDALLNGTVGDIDLAVNLPPDPCNAALNLAGIKTVPTGIAHGTLTAVIDHQGFEITSLRRDIATDGRHATVEFGTDWQEDAGRRDFTFNALYADRNGQIYDYFDGRRDLAAGRVRFIGDAESRIREDVLRILRFFRFFAWYGQLPADPDALAACQNLATLIPQLSVERIWRELGKLLSASNPVAAWDLMQQSNIITHIIPTPINQHAIDKIIEVEKSHGLAPLALRRLAALLPTDANAALQVAKHLKMSKREQELLQKLTAIAAKLNVSFDAQTLPELIYRNHPYLIENACTISAAFNKNVAQKLVDILRQCADWAHPVFPLNGQDVLAIPGIKPGLYVGELLHKTEDWWVQQNFTPDHRACLDHLHALVAEKKA